jgi:hypothetical protein
LIGALILNSLLFGVMLFFLFAAVGSVSVVLDQQLTYRSLPTVTEWAVNFRPKDLISTLSLIIAAIATSLFVGLSLRGTLISGQSALLYLTVHSSLWLLAASYFLFFVMAVAFSQIHIHGDLYAAGHGPQRPTMIAPSLIASWLWLAAALIYSLGLLLCGIFFTRRHKAASNPAHP